MQQPNSLCYRAAFSLIARQKIYTPVPILWNVANKSISVTFISVRLRDLHLNIKTLYPDALVKVEQSDTDNPNWK